MPYFKKETILEDILTFWKPEQINDRLEGTSMNKIELTVFS